MVQGEAGVEERGGRKIMDRKSAGQRAVVFEDCRGEVAPGFDDPLFLEAIARPEDLWDIPSVEVLLEGRNRVAAVRLPFSSGLEKEVVVKEFRLRGLVRLKSFIRPSKAARAWGGAWALRRRGVGTAPPAAYLEKRRRGLVEQSWFLAERISGAEEVRGLFRRLGPGDLEPLLIALAGFLARCHDQGILHRDLSDGNVLVKKDDAGRFAFYLLDTNRIRLRKRMGALRRSKNLIRLGIPPAFQKAFLQEYPEDKRFRRIHWLWYRLNKSVFAFYIGLKRKLRLRRVARFLRIQ